MTLYEKIIEYEGKQTKTMVEKVAEMDQIVAMSLDLFGDTQIQLDKDKARILLDKAYALNGSQLTNGELETLLDQFERVDGEALGMSISDQEIKVARKEWIRARVEFYQQVIKQDGAESYEEAVRARFGDRETYESALKPVNDTESGVYQALIELMPFMKPCMETAAEAARQVQEEELDKIFPQ